MTAIPTAQGPGKAAPKFPTLIGRRNTRGPLAKETRTAREQVSEHQASKSSAIEGLIRILDKPIDFSDIDIGKTTSALDGPLVFGRSKEFGFNIENNDHSISRRHFMLRRLSNGSFQVMDLNSRHGTHKLTKDLKSIQKIKPETWVTIDELSPLKIGGGNTWLILNKDEFFITNVKLVPNSSRKTYRPYAFASFQLNKPKVQGSSRPRGRNSTRRRPFLNEPLNMPVGSGPHNIQSTKTSKSSRSMSPTKVNSKAEPGAQVFKKGEPVNFKGAYQITMIADGFFQYTSGAIVFDSKYKTLTLNHRDSRTVDEWIKYFTLERSQTDQKFRIAMSLLKDLELEAAYELIKGEINQAEAKNQEGNIEKFKALKMIVEQVHDTRHKK
jgi:hypothetical protein